MSIVPGLRYEYIQTKSEGYYREINTDNAVNVILNQINSSYDKRERSFLLFGLGYSYNLSNQLEMYANCSQNYRAVTFADINIVNPSFIIDPEISDEDGYNLDLGFRGTLNKHIRYDLSFFYMFYNNRIGFVQRTFYDMSVKNQKGNVGDAHINGIEILLNFNLTDIFNLNSDYNLSWFVNNSILASEYVSSQVNGVEGNQVEFVPKYNFRSGLKFNFQKLNFNLQYSYLSSQFTDATNSVESDMSGLIGLIPSYSILDFSMSYILKNINIELGCNNILDTHYFTTRVTGYPGPGIIPSINRNFYITLEYKF
jgi:Fe(3+) dicitrate transport protein